MEDKIVKCLLLDVDNVIITEIIEMDADIGEPNCKLINPYLFNSAEDMKPWKSDITNQNEFMIRSDDNLTIADPTGAITDKYLELTA